MDGRACSKTRSFGSSTACGARSRPTSTAAMGCSSLNVKTAESTTMNSAPSTKPPTWTFWLLAGAISLYAIWGVARVPFHPDESTNLFMSADLDVLLSNPTSMAWEATKGVELRQHYRMIDAPITRYLLGLGRSIAGLPALPADWNWGISWENNRQAGGLPDDRLLWAGRLAITLLLPFSLLFSYLIGRRMDGEASGLLSVVLLG